MPDAGVEVESNADELDDDESLPDLPVLLKASQVDMDQQEQRIKDNAAKKRIKKEGASMQSLMTYSHVDTSSFGHTDDEDMEALIADKVLLKVLKEEDNQVSFVFAKTFGG